MMRIFILVDESSSLLRALTETSSIANGARHRLAQFSLRYFMGLVLMGVFSYTSAAKFDVILLLGDPEFL